MEKEKPRRFVTKKQPKDSESRVEEDKTADTESTPQAKKEPVEKKAKAGESKGILPTFSAKVLGERTHLKSHAQNARMAGRGQRQTEDLVEIPVQYIKAPRAKPTPQQLEVEADLYAAIATLNSLIGSFENGNLDTATYKRQVQALITDVMKSRIMLERSGISMEEFLNEERIREQYPLVCEKLKLCESDETLRSFIESLAVTKADIASGTAEIVTDLITLTDYAKLGGDMAKVESLAPLFDRLVSLLEDFPTTRRDYWGVELLKAWRAKLTSLPLDVNLDSDDANRLENDIVRLLEDFKKRLKEI